MATLAEYFSKDFSNALTQDFAWEIKSSAQKIFGKVGLETYSNAKFIAYYVPKNDDYITVCRDLVALYPEALGESNKVEVISGFVGDIHVGVRSSLLSIFSNTIYIYLENEFSKDEFAAIESAVCDKGLSLTLRGGKYLYEKNRLERPQAFISHDSRDKKEVALPIAIGLQKMLCPVWYDEFSLKVGDNLRTSIEQGLKEAKKCVLVLSPNFMSNDGWTKTEFDSVFTRELIEKESVILPVWVNVSAKEVYSYSPSLVNKVAVNWELGEAEVVSRLYRAIGA